MLAAASSLIFAWSLAAISEPAGPRERSGCFAGISSRIERAEYEFASVPGAWGEWSAPNRAQGIRARVSNAGVEIEPRDPDAADSNAPWTLRVATRSFGRVESAAELAPARVHATGERAELDHGELSEWFVNDERGIEQGWTIARAPAGGGPLWIGLDVGGDLDLRIDDGARSGVFVDASGETRLRYIGLLAFDALGCELDARLVPTPEGVGIVVDDSHAIYPVTVDPTLTGPAWTAEGNQHGAWFGASVACAGDVNGDGYSDVIIGAPTYDNGQPGEGRAFVYLGGSGGLATTPAWTAESDQPFAEFGSSVATAGDVDGDGYSDVIIAASLYDGGQTEEGRVFVYRGSSTGLSATPAWTAECDQGDAIFGTSVATAGDVNGDGYSDVVVGAWNHDGGEANEGRAFLYLGSSTGLAATPAWTAESDQADARFGACVAPAGDVDGDGFDDVIVGADQYDNGELDEGRAYLFRGSASGLSASAAWTTESDQAIVHLGLSVATAGDVNADGFSDVIVGASFYSNGNLTEGRALVFHGSSTGLSTNAAWTAESDQDFTSFASSVATAGDVNADGYSDVIVGALAFENGLLNEGAAFVYLGTATGLESSASWSAEGNQFSARYGYSVACAGDVNGDGRSDAIVSAVLYTNGQPSEGRAYVYHGRSAALAPTPCWTSYEHADDEISIASAGDVNGDGYSDVIYGDPFYSAWGLHEGRAGLTLGSVGGPVASVSWNVVGNQFGGWFGRSLSSAGDVDGDGFADAIIGSPNSGNGQESEGRAFLYRGSIGGLQSIAAWSGEGNWLNAQYGSAVASAGDVNGDGHGDVIVGAHQYGAHGGRAYVYHGASDGLSTTPRWTADAGRADAHFGVSVASAGDVDGDGYSDVIVGATGFDDGEPFEGAAFVYSGSRAGLSVHPAWSADGDQSSALFGALVASAGDVNGDGYSDVLVGAPMMDHPEIDEGVVYLYSGSSAGLAASPSWIWESNDAGVGFDGFGIDGIAFASAGDVNGDGYGDVILGAPGFNPPTGPGRAWLFLGSSTGLAWRPAWSVDGEPGEPFATEVASAGDVNGDGYGDVLIADDRRARVYLGNEGRGGWTLAPQQRRVGDVAAIQWLGRSNDDLRFRIHLPFSRELAGFTWASGAPPRAKLEWEVKPLFAPLDGSGLESGAYRDVGGSLLKFDEIAEFASEVPLSRMYHWRARIRTNNPLLPVTPWVTLAGQNVSEAKLRSAPARSLR